jgi:hypothetical protein
MRRFIVWVVALVALCVMVSCEKEVDLGYPKVVSFGKDGGEKVIAGAVDFSGAYIHDYKSGDDGEYVPREGELECQVYKWLTVEYVPHSAELKIIAEPNTSAKSRTLHVELHSGPDYQVVEVQQL